MPSPPTYRRDGTLTGYADRVATVFAQAVLTGERERAQDVAGAAPDLADLFRDIVRDRDLAIYMAQTPLTKSLGHAGSLPVIAIGPQGGKIVGYQGGDLKKPIYAGTAAAKSLAEEKGDDDAGTHGLAEMLSTLVDHFGLKTTPVSKIGETYQSTVQGSQTALAAAKSTYDGPGVSWVPISSTEYKLVLDPSAGLEPADYSTSTVKQKGGPPPAGWPEGHPGPGAIFVKTVDGATYTLEVVAEGAKPAYVVTSPGPLFLFAGGAYGAVQGQVGDGPPVAVKFASASAAAIACLGPKEKDGKWIKKSTNGHWWWGWKGKTKKKAPDIAPEQHTGEVAVAQQVDLSEAVDSATALAGEAGVLWVDGQPPEPEPEPEPESEPAPVVLPDDWALPHPPGTVVSKTVPNVKNGPKNAGKPAVLVLLPTGEMQAVWPEGGAVYDKKGNEVADAPPGHSEVFGSPTAAAQAFTGTPTNGHKWWFKLGEVQKPEPGEDSFETMPEGTIPFADWIKLAPADDVVDAASTDDGPAGDAAFAAIVNWLASAELGTTMGSWKKVSGGWESPSGKEETHKGFADSYLEFELGAEDFAPPAGSAQPESFADWIKAAPADAVFEAAGGGDDASIEIVVNWLSSAEPGTVFGAWKKIPGGWSDPKGSENDEGLLGLYPYLTPADFAAPGQPTFGDWISSMPSLDVEDDEPETQDAKVVEVSAWLDAAPVGTTYAVTSGVHAGYVTWTKTEGGWVHNSSPDPKPTDDLAWEAVFVPDGSEFKPPADNFETMPEATGAGGEPPEPGPPLEQPPPGPQAVEAWLKTVPEFESDTYTGLAITVGAWIDEAPLGTVINFAPKFPATVKKIPEGWQNEKTGTVYGPGDQLPIGLLKGIAAGVFGADFSPEPELEPEASGAAAGWLAAAPDQGDIPGLKSWLKDAPEGTSWDSAPGKPTGGIYTKIAGVWGKVAKGHEPPGTPYSNGLMAKIVSGFDGFIDGFTLAPPPPSVALTGEAWAESAPGIYSVDWLMNAPAGTKFDLSGKGLGVYTKGEDGWDDVAGLAGKLSDVDVADVPIGAFAEIAEWANAQPEGTGAVDSLPGEWADWLAETPPGVTFGPIEKTQSGWSWVTPQEGESEKMLPAIASGWFAGMVEVTATGETSLNEPLEGEPKLAGGWVGWQAEYPGTGPGEAETPIETWIASQPDNMGKGSKALPWLKSAPVGSTVYIGSTLLVATAVGTWAANGKIVPTSDVWLAWKDGNAGFNPPAPTTAPPISTPSALGATAGTKPTGWPAWAPPIGTEYEHNGWVVEVIDHFGHPGFMVEGEHHALHLDDLATVAAHIEAADGSPPGSVLPAITQGLGLTWPPAGFAKFSATKKVKIAKKAPENKGKSFKIEESPAGYTVTWLDGGKDFATGQDVQPGYTADFGSLTAAGKAVANAAVNAAVWWGAQPNSKGKLTAGVTLNVEPLDASVPPSGADIFDHLFDDEVNWEDWENDSESPPGEWLEYAPDGAVIHVGQDNYWKVDGLWHSATGAQIPPGELVDGLDRDASVTIQGLGPDGKTYPKGTTFEWASISHTLSGQLDAAFDKAVPGASFFPNPKHANLTTIQVPAAGLDGDTVKEKIEPVLKAHGLAYDPDDLVKHVGGSYIYLAVPLIDGTKVVSTETVVVPHLPKFPTKSNNELLDAPPLPEHSLLGLAIDADSDSIADQHVKQRLLKGGKRELTFKLTQWARAKANAALASAPAGKLDFGTGGVWNGKEAPAIKKAHFSPTTKKVVGSGWEGHVAGGKIWTFEGTVRLTVDAGVDPRAALNEFGAKAGLGPLAQAPSDDDAELFKALKLLYSVDPQAHDKLVKAGETAPPSLLVVQKALGKHGVSVGDAVYVSPTPSHRTISLQDGEKIRQSGLLGVRHNWGNSDADSLANVLAMGGLMSSEVRMNTGVGGFGISTSADVSTGGAAGVFTHAIKVGQKPTNSALGGKTYSLFYGTEALERADWTAYTGDDYGTTKPSDGKYSNRPKRYKAGKGKIGEIVFRHGLGIEELTGVKCNSQAARSALITALKGKGITHLRGVPVEDAVVVSADEAAKLIEDDWNKTLQERAS